MTQKASIVRWKCAIWRFRFGLIKALDQGWHPPGKPDAVRRFAVPFYRIPEAIGCALIVGKWQACIWLRHQEETANVQ